MSCPELVGRAEELAFLRQAFERAAGGVASMVLVAGEAGVGKTRLVSDLAATVRSTGARVWVGHCLSNAEHLMPYAPIVGIVRDAIPSLGADTVRELASHAATLVPALAPESGSGGAAWPTVDGQMQARQWTKLLWLLNQLADEPTLIVIEDLHWADSATRGLLNVLVHGLMGRVLIVCTYRDDEMLATHPLRPVLAELHRAGTPRITLRRFQLAETAAQIAGILGTEPTGAHVERVFRRSGGNAFFVEELLASGPDDEGLCTGLRDILLLRVHQLPDLAKHVVRAVALAGRPIEHALLAEALRLPEAELNAALEAAVERYVLVPDGGCYVFRHALVSEAVAADALPGERIRLHRAFGEAIDARLASDGPPTPAHAALLAEAAHHWFAAGDAARALPLTVDAALAAERTYALAETYRLFRRALDLWWEAPLGRAEAALDLVGLYQHTAHAAYTMSEAEAALVFIRRGLDEVDEFAEPLRAATMYRWQGRYMLAAGRPLPATLDAFETAARVVPDEPTVERAEVLAARASMVMLATRHAQALDLAREAAAVAKQVGAPAHESHAVMTMGACLAMLGDPEPGITLLRQALSISTSVDDWLGMWRTYVTLSDVLFNTGRLTEAVDFALSGLSAFPDGNLPREYHDDLLGNAVEALFWLGRWDQAARHLDEHGEPAMGTVGSLGMWLCAAALHTARGDFDRAAERIARCELWRQGSYVDLIGQIQACHAELQLWRGQPGAALDSAREGLDALTDGHHQTLKGRLLAAAARASAEGDREAAPGVADRIAALREVGGLTRLAEAHLANADGELSRIANVEDQAWAHAVKLWEQLEIPHQAAYAQLRLAEALLYQGGNRSAATRALDAAHDRATTLGARPLSEEIAALAQRGRLRLHGQAPVSAPTPLAKFGLTAREEEVLLRIAHGDTNRQIARALFISEKTVSLHVSRILAKMGVPNRAAATATAHRLHLLEPS